MKTTTQTTLAVTVLWLGLVSVASAAYCTTEDYFSGTGFFDRFDFFTADDYTHGYVNYTDRATAATNGLISTSSNGVYIGVDKTNVASGRGRGSVRIESKKTYTQGLFILDLTHMPGGACGEWPAFWTYGPNWPNSGEIDIIEGVNSQNSNLMAVHTTSGCSISNNNNMSGYPIFYNCDVNAANQPSNSGCSIGTSNTATYGSGFNAAGGGVIAMQWNNTGVYIFIFNRNSIPADITGGKPIPGKWGKPVGIWSSPCVMNNYLANHKIVFDITFCGDWADGVWSSDSTCSAKGSSCRSYVQNNPSDFADSYWQIKSFKIYTDNNSGKDTCPGKKRDLSIEESSYQIEDAADLPTVDIPANSDLPPPGDEPNYEHAAAGIHLESLVPGQGMVVVDEGDFYSPHKNVGAEDTETPSDTHTGATDAATDSGTELQSDNEAGVITPPESAASATPDDEGVAGEALEKRQGPHVGANGIVQMGQPRPGTVTVTSTVYSGSETSTIANGANPTTMVKTTTRPPAAPSPKKGSNVNLMQANAFGGWRNAPGQQQQVTTKTTSATLTLTKSLGSRDASAGSKIKKPRGWYEDRDEDMKNESEADLNIITGDTDTAAAALEHDMLQERLYVLPEDLENLVGGGAHHHREDEMDEDLEWERLFGPSSSSSSSGSASPELHDKEHTHPHSHAHSHSHAHHHIRHSHSHAHSHDDHDHDHDHDEEEHYYAGHDLHDIAELTPQRMLQEMQRRRAEEKKAAQLRSELAEIELRRVKEMLARRGGSRHAGGGAGGAGMKGRGKGWW